MDFVKKNDKIVSLGVLLLTVIFVFVFTRTFFLSFAEEYKIIGGFVKFFFLATIGDFIGLRLRQKYWSIPNKVLYKAIIWGAIGIVIVLMFQVFSGGVLSLISTGILPNIDSLLYQAFLISFFMNLIFAPVMMAFHRLTDTALDQGVSLVDAIAVVDWTQFYRVVLSKTIPFFWIPAHTITFILPAEYRIIFAAVLGIVLGLLLSVFKK